MRRNKLYICCFLILIVLLFSCNKTKKEVFTKGSFCYWRVFYDEQARKENYRIWKTLFPETMMTYTKYQYYTFIYFDNMGRCIKFCGKGNDFREQEMDDGSLYSPIWELRNDSMVMIFENEYKFKVLNSKKILLQYGTDKKYVDTIRLARPKEIPYKYRRLYNGKTRYYHKISS